MKKPKYIYNYWQTDNKSCNITEYQILIRKPSAYNEQSKYYFQFADDMFTIRAQSNNGADDKYHTKGLRQAYAIRVEGLSAGKPEAFELAAKLCKDVHDDGAMKVIIKRLRKLGAVRYSLGKVDSPNSYNQREFMPRKYAGKKSVAYWNAIQAGLKLE